jgi:hypothetical protein
MHVLWTSAASRRFVVPLVAPVDVTQPGIEIGQLAHYAPGAVGSALDNPDSSSVQPSASKDLQYTETHYTSGLGASLHAHAAILEPPNLLANGDASTGTVEFSGQSEERAVDWLRIASLQAPGTQIASNQHSSASGSYNRPPPTISPPLESAFSDSSLRSESQRQYSEWNPTTLSYDDDFIFSNPENHHILSDPQSFTLPPLSSSLDLTQPFPGYLDHNPFSPLSNESENWIIRYSSWHDQQILPGGIEPVRTSHSDVTASDMAQHRIPMQTHALFPPSQDGLNSKVDVGGSWTLSPSVPFPQTLVGPTSP